MNRQKTLRQIHAEYYLHMILSGYSRAKLGPEIRAFLLWCARQDQVGESLEESDICPDCAHALHGKNPCGEPEGDLPHQICSCGSREDWSEETDRPTRVESLQSAVDWMQKAHEVLRSIRVDHPGIQDRLDLLLQRWKGEEDHGDRRFQIGSERSRGVEHIRQLAHGCTECSRCLEDQEGEVEYPNQQGCRDS